MPAPRRYLALAALYLATPAAATLDDDSTVPSYSGLCRMTETCTDTGACGTTPSVGELLLEQDAHGTLMGRGPDNLRPIEHFALLADALEIPWTEGFRRTFLTDLPPEGRTRRFAVHVQTIDADTGAPVLRPQYFVLSCEAL